MVRSEGALSSPTHTERGKRQKKKIKEEEELESDLSIAKSEPSKEKLAVGFSSKKEFTSGFNQTGLGLSISIRPQTFN